MTGGTSDPTQKVEDGTASVAMGEKKKPRDNQPLNKYNMIISLLVLVSTMFMEPHTFHSC